MHVATGRIEILIRNSEQGTLQISFTNICLNLVKKNLSSNHDRGFIVFKFHCE